MQGIDGKCRKSAVFPLVMFALLYFVLIAPNQRKQKKWQEMLSQLKSGDRVTTNGGIRGVVLVVKDDVVQLRVAPDNVKAGVCEECDCQRNDAGRVTAEILEERLRRPDERPKRSRVDPQT